MTPTGGFARWSAFLLLAASTGGSPRPITREMRLRPLTRPRGDRAARARRRDRRRARDRHRGRDHRLPRPVDRERASRCCSARSASSGRSRAAGMFVLPRRRLVASRWREPFFLLWSCSVVGSIAFGVVLEGRPGHAAAVRLHPAADLRRDLLPGRRDGDRRLARARVRRRGAARSPASPPPTLTFQLMALAFAAVMGVWQALRPRAPRRAARRPSTRRAQQYLDVAGTMIVLLDGDGCDRARQPPQLRGARLHRGGAARRATGSSSPSPRTCAGRRARRLLRAALAGLKPTTPERETPVVTRAGERRCIAWTGRIVPTRTGAGMLIAGEDVTDQRAAQEHVRAHGLPRRAHRPGQPRQARGAR